MNKNRRIPNLEEKLNENDWKSKIGFEFHGLKIGVRLDDSVSVENLRKFFPPGSREILYDETERSFSLITDQNNSLRGFYVEVGGEILLAQGFEKFDGTDIEAVMEALESKILLALTLIAPPKMFFFHAGAFLFKGVGVIIPGRTHAGKTTLVTEFIKNGAEYYSDDCALIDAEGFLHPYPVLLGVRGENERNYLKAEEFGAKTGVAPIKVEYILFTEYSLNAVWNPLPVKPAQAAFRMLENVFYGEAVRRQPSETLEFLKNLTSRVKAFESFRSDTSSVIGWIEEKILAN